MQVVIAIHLFLLVVSGAVSKSYACFLSDGECAFETAKKGKLAKLSSKTIEGATKLMKNQGVETAWFGTLLDKSNSKGPFQLEASGVVNTRGSFTKTEARCLLDLKKNSYRLYPSSTHSSSASSSSSSSEDFSDDKPSESPEKPDESAQQDENFCDICVESTVQIIPMSCCNGRICFPCLKLMKKCPYCQTEIGK